MKILTSVRRLYISFKSLVNDSVYSFGRAALLLLVEVYNHTVPARERHRIRVNITRVSVPRGLTRTQTPLCNKNDIPTYRQDSNTSSELSTYFQTALIYVRPLDRCSQTFCLRARFDSENNQRSSYSCPR